MQLPIASGNDTDETGEGEPKHYICRLENETSELKDAEQLKKSAGDLQSQTVVTVSYNTLINTRQPLNVCHCNWQQQTSESESF